LLSNFVIFIDFHCFIDFYFCLRLSILPVVLLAYLSREKDILENMTVNKQMLKASKFGCVTKKSCPSHIINTVNIRHNLTDCHENVQKILQIIHIIKALSLLLFTRSHLQDLIYKIFGFPLMKYSSSDL